MKRVAFILFLSTISACFIFLLNGCETTSASDKTYITPSTAVVKIGNAVEFTASGGYEYTWSLQNQSLGTLSSLRGSRVVYRSLYDPGSSNTAIQVLTVSSTITGASETTNAPSFEQTAEALITHISTNQ